MEYAHVILASLFSILALFLITKLLGCRQMNQLSMFDYINGITIGSIAAELAHPGERNSGSGPLPWSFTAWPPSCSPWPRIAPSKRGGSSLERPFHCMKTGSCWIRISAVPS